MVHCPYLHLKMSTVFIYRILHPLLLSYYHDRAYIVIANCSHPRTVTDLPCVEYDDQ
jgi:hypothetical protein